MIGRDEFVAKRSARWDELERLLVDKGLHRLPPATISRIAALYRSICADLMRARSLGIGADVTGHLDVLASRAHNVLYAPKPYRLRALWELVLFGFPRAFRANWRFNLLAFVLFYLPFVVGILGALHSTEFAEGILPRSMLRGMEEAYSHGFDDGRATGADAAMAGFYVHNNVGIAFRCFSTGILFGFGSMFFLVYNGLVTGTVLGHVMHVGHGVNILTFVCGHSPFELNAIVIAGGAGLQMGYALVRTDGLTRTASLRRRAPELFAQISGAAFMLLIAAFIEGFWSPSSIPPPVKWGFAGVMTILVLLYLLLFGRQRTRPVKAKPGRKRGDSADAPPPSSRMSSPPPSSRMSTPPVSAPPPSFASPRQGG
ncbi:MAG: stage II sporulation protein M [Myxococcales bacterium]|nr:stage II sporulation protein M [Myxococcales bacterium]